MRATSERLVEEALGVLRGKGWVVTGWRESVLGVENGFAVEFFLLAPPVRWSREARPELPDERSPRVGFAGRSVEDAAEKLLCWAGDSPGLSLPFSQGLCDRCRGQGADWAFSTCMCPRTGSGGYGSAARFADGLPEGCAYAAEQVVTMPERMETARAAFAGCPEALEALKSRLG